MTTRICTFGDAVLDVIVELKQLPVEDDDVPSETALTAGGQAANVAAWAAVLGSSAAVISKIGTDPAGTLVRALLGEQGVDVFGPESPRNPEPRSAEPRSAEPRSATGIITSIVTPGGRRSMASYRGATASFAADELDPEWFAGCTWLHVSGYALFDAGSSGAAIAASELARRAGGAVSLDLSAATLVESLDAAEVQRRVAAVAPSVLFANAAEHRAAPRLDVPVVVVKRGAGGASVLAGGSETHLPAHPAPAVRDTTGAGDAFAAGWLVGGADLAVATARRCVVQRGAMPAPGARLGGSG